MEILQYIGQIFAKICGMVGCAGAGLLEMLKDNANNYGEMQKRTKDK